MQSLLRINQKIYLNINKFYESESPTRHRSLVLDENNPFHAFCTVLIEASRRLHCLCNCSGSRKRFQPSEKQHRSLRASNVACPIVRKQRSPSALIRQSCTLRIVYFHPPAIMLRARLYSSSKGSSSRSAVRSWRRNGNERKVGINKLLSFLGCFELSKAKTFGYTLKSTGDNGQVKRIRRVKWCKCLYCDHG